MNIAVENFLASIDPETPKTIHMMNLARDARLYKWNTKTIMAILEGIEKAYACKTKT